jgi:hypothetical protein
MLRIIFIPFLDPFNGNGLCLPVNSLKAGPHADKRGAPVIAIASHGFVTHIARIFDAAVKFDLV